MSVAVGLVPAFFAWAFVACAWLVVLSSASLASVAEPVAAPSHAEASRLVWSTMIGVDQAIDADDFSVLLALSAPGFRERNDGDRLRQAFASLVEQNAELSRTIGLTPVFLEPPALTAEGVLRLVGGFGSRPVGIHFDLLFQRIDRKWRLLALALTPVVTNPVESPSDK